MAKTENKLLLYSALGIPFLCSDVPAYRDYVERLGLGFICREPGDWVRGLRQLAEEARLCEAIMERGPRVVAEHYGMDVIARKYLKLRDDLVGCADQEWAGPRRTP